MQTPLFEKHVWAEIDLDALRHNFRTVKSRAGEMPLCAVVKADSYGHGAVECAKVFAEEGAAWLAVSCLAEARQLRQAGLRLPILILGHVEPGCAAVLMEQNITAACYSLSQAKALSEAASAAGGTVDVHLKADTGMGRIGFALRTDFDAALAGMLEEHKGKKVYGYLKKPAKAQVDAIVDELAKVPEVAECYEQWNQLRDELERYYKDAPRERLPLSQQKEFKAIKNMVIREAERLRLGTFTFEDARMRDEVDEDQDAVYFVWNSSWRMAEIYQSAKEVLEEYADRSE